MITPGILHLYPVEAQNLRRDLARRLEHTNHVDLRALVEPYTYLGFAANGLAEQIAREACLEGTTFLRWPGPGTLDWILARRARASWRSALPAPARRRSTAPLTMEALERVPSATVGDLARNTGLPPATVRTHLYRFRHCLRVIRTPGNPSLNRYAIPKESSCP